MTAFRDSGLLQRRRSWQCWLVFGVRLFDARRASSDGAVFDIVDHQRADRRRHGRRAGQGIDRDQGRQDCRRRQRHGTGGADHRRQGPHRRAGLHRPAQPFGHAARHRRQRPEQDPAGRDHRSDRRVGIGRAAQGRIRATQPWTDFDGYFAAIEKGGISPNLLSYVGTGTVRETRHRRGRQEGHAERHHRHAADRLDDDGRRACSACRPA